MTISPPMGAEAERRSRSEMADWTDSQLLTAIAKAPGLAAGIAAQQILEERKAQDRDAKHQQLLGEIRRPHWSVTPSFVLLVLTTLISLAALLVAIMSLSQGQSPSQRIAQPASASQQGPTVKEAQDQGSQPRVPATSSAPRR